MSNKVKVERPRFTKIEGTDLIYTVCSNGVYDNGEELLNSEEKGPARLGIYVIKIFNTFGASMEEFEEDYRNGYAQMVAYTEFEKSQYRDIQLDRCGNLLLRSAGSKLKPALSRYLKNSEKNVRYDYLISKTGEILVQPANYSLLQALAPADENGYYYSHVYRSKSAPMSRIVDVYRRDYNFFDRNGVRIRQENFERTEEPTLHSLERYYRDDSDGKLFNKRGVYPKSYIYDSGLGSEDVPRYFPSPAHLLVAHRKQKMEHPELPPLVENEDMIILDHCNRQKNISKVQAMLTRANVRGTLSFEKYRRAMQLLDAEQNYVNSVFEVYKTERDDEIQDMVDLGEGLTEEDVME